MLLLSLWFLLSLTLTPAPTLSQENRCQSEHTKLFITVETREDTNLTITQLKNIVSYFFSLVKDGLITTLDVCAVDLFQGETLFNLTNVTSLLELTTVVDLVRPYYGNGDPFENIEKKFKSWKSDNFEGVLFVTINLLRCYGKCLEQKYFIENLLGANDILNIIILSSFFKKMDNFMNRVSDSKVHYLFVDSDDDFSNYNPVAIEVCRDCPKNWIRHTKNGKQIVCYSVFLLDKPVSWIQASNHCIAMRSTMPVLETEAEQKFVTRLVKIHGQAVSRNHNVNDKQVPEIIYVGLFKKDGAEQGDYIWSNLRPFNLQVTITPNKDSRHRCVAISFNQNSTNQVEGISWLLVNCNERKSRIVVCETEGLNGHNTDELRDNFIAGTQSNPKRRALNISECEKVQTHETQEWGMFDCKDSGYMVSFNDVCDGTSDCDNSRDEQYCYSLSDSHKFDFFYCVDPNAFDGYPSRRLVRSEARCDFIQDCPDNSNEQGCDGCLGRRCSDGTCVPSHWLSRDLDECNLFIGTNGRPYLNVSYPCNGHCSGIIQFHHEVSFCNRNINLEIYSVGQKIFENLTSREEWAPKCLYLRNRGRKATGCHDRIQLTDCRTFHCPEGFVKCPGSYCIPVYHFKDGVHDCLYGEDEVISENIFQYDDNFVKCKKTTIAVHEVHICDGIAQCPFGDDETSCNGPCPSGFKCQGGAVEPHNYTDMKPIESLNIFNLKTKYLNLHDINLSKLKETFTFPNLLEIHASNCNLVKLDKLIGFYNYFLYAANLSYNKINELEDHGPISSLMNLQFLSLSHNEQLKTIGKSSIKSKRLHTLDLSFTGISVLNIFAPKNFQFIRFLNISNTKIKHIDLIYTPRQFDFLNLENTLLSSADVTKILKSVSVSSGLFVDKFKLCCPQISGNGTPRHACHAPPEAFSSCEDLLSDVLKRSLLWLVAGVSLAGNIIVVTYRLFYDKGVFKKGYGIFVTNLSVSDCVMGVYLMIIASADVRYRDEYVLHESDWRHSSLCQAAGFLSTLSSETSTFFVFLITLDRYLVIRFPFGNHRFTKWGLVLCTLFVWSMGFILAFVPLMYSQWIIYSSNGMCLGLPLGISQNDGWHYSFGIFICVNFIMFIFIACGQLFIFRLISSSYSFQMTNVQSVARRVQEINVAKQLFLVVLSNFLCWFPICVLGFLTFTGHEVSPDTYAWLVVFVLPLNAAINPMIYTIPVMYSKWRDFKRGETTMT